jgi:hypothetical protein
MKQCLWCNQLFEMRKTGGSPQQYCCRDCRRAASRLDHSAYERYRYAQRKAADPTFLTRRAAASRKWRARYPNRVNRARDAKRPHIQAVIYNTLAVLREEGWQI